VSRQSGLHLEVAAADEEVDLDALRFLETAHRVVDLVQLPVHASLHGDLHSTPSEALRRTISTLKRNCQNRGPSSRCSEHTGPHPEKRRAEERLVGSLTFMALRLIRRRRGSSDCPLLDEAAEQREVRGGVP
jgi:hypothetical protein